MHRDWLLRGIILMACAMSIADDTRGSIITAVWHTAVLPPQGLPPATFVSQMVAWMDTTLDAAAPADTAGDSETLFFGNGIRPLLDFQSALPPATNMRHATLFLYNCAGGAMASVAWTARLVTNTWAEFEASWSNRFVTTPWSAPGGDLASVPSNSGVIVCLDEEYHAFDLTTVLQAYALNPAAYAGVLFTTADAAQAEPVYLSVDNALNDAQQQPYLVLIYDDGRMVYNEEPFEAFDIALSSDYATAILGWTNLVVADVLACTNQYYTPDPGQWYTRASSVSGLWCDIRGTNLPMVYYRLVSKPAGIYTSTYDVGKYSVNLAAGNGTDPGYTWVSHPFELPVNGLPLATALGLALSNVASPATADVVMQKVPPGSPNALSSSLVNNRFTGSDQRTNIYAGSGCIVKVYPAHTTPTVARFVGRVRNAPSTFVASVPHSDGASARVTWAGPVYPAPLALVLSGLTNTLTRVGLPLMADRVTQKIPPDNPFSLVASYVNGNFTGADARTNMYPGSMLMIEINKSHQTGATDFYQLRPW